MASTAANGSMPAITPPETLDGATIALTTNSTTVETTMVMAPLAVANRDPLVMAGRSRSVDATSVMLSPAHHR